MSAAFFSIIVPTYNNDREIRRCMESILAQTYADFELIIVDDGSTDDTPYICDHYASLDSRVRVIHKKNEGTAAARNDGLFQAAGKYVYFVDADDWIERELLLEAHSVLDTVSAPDIFIFGFRMLMEKGQTVTCPCYGEGLYDKERLRQEIYPVMMDPRRKGTWLPHVSSYLCDKIILRDLCMQHYCRDTTLFMGEESVCAYECVYFAEKIYFSPDIMYLYDCTSESSMHRRYHEDLFENYIRLAQYYRTYLGGRGDAGIEKQINRSECRSLIHAIKYEMEFSTSICHSASLFSKKIAKMAVFPICPVSGLSFRDTCFVLMLSLRMQFLFSLYMKIVKQLSGLKRMLMKRMDQEKR